MHLQGESSASTAALRPALAFPHHHHGTSIHIPAPPRVGPIAVGARIVQQEGVKALFSGRKGSELHQRGGRDRADVTAGRDRELVARVGNDGE
ncbi:unnamed protein product [Linum tenue]|uniref:Uncharacterized protein n=1 Tax=Linum tenue TaxID=586396 RepID=A0AAV0J1E3_9ROSI|nr:unnamed protein product [Linum tenue]